jgi:hypothetical protein
MPADTQTIIVSSRAALDEAVSVAVERTLKRLNVAPLESEAPGIGWLTNKEAQRTLQTSKATLARWRADGTLPYSKVGQSVYYSVEDVNALLESRRVRRAA